MTGWQAHLQRDATSWMAREVRLHLVWRGAQGGREVVGWDAGGRPVVRDVEPGAQLGPGFAIPEDALPSLRDAIEPGPAAAEVRRLEEALDVERIRVDRVLPGQAQPSDGCKAEVLPGDVPLVVVVPDDFVRTADVETADGRVGHGSGAVVINPSPASMSPLEARILALALIRQAGYAEQAAHDPAAAAPPRVRSPVSGPGPEAPQSESPPA